MERNAARAARIEAVRRRIDGWRRVRVKRSPMPKDLWEAAAELAREHGASLVARELGVGYATLRERSGSGVVRGAQTAASPGFVEVDAGQLFGSSPERRTEVELRDSDGTTLVIRIGERDKVDVAGLVEMFRGRRP